jgi:hypothetical protein
MTASGWIALVSGITTVGALLLARRLHVRVKVADRISDRLAARVEMFTRRNAELAQAIRDLESRIANHRARTDRAVYDRNAEEWLSDDAREVLDATFGAVVATIPTDEDLWLGELDPVHIELTRELGDNRD